MERSFPLFGLELCEHFIDSKSQKMCIEVILQQDSRVQLVESFSFENKIDECRKFKHQSSYETCLRIALTRSVKYGNTPDICHKLKNQDTVSKCMYEGLVSRHGSFRDTLICQKIPALDYRQRCFEIIGYASRLDKIVSWKECLNSFSTRSEQCMYDFFQRLKERGISYDCSSIKNEEASHQCSKVWSVDKHVFPLQNYGKYFPCYPTARDKEYPLRCSEDFVREANVFNLEDDFKACLNKPDYKIQQCITKAVQTGKNTLKDCKIFKKVNDAALFHFCRQEYQLGLKTSYASIGFSDSSCSDLKDDYYKSECGINKIIKQIKYQLDYYFHGNSKIKEILAYNESTQSFEEPRFSDRGAKDTTSPFFQSDSILMTQRKHRRRNTSSSDKFTKIEGSSKNIISEDFRLMDFIQPFSYGRGISAGDINRDGFEDLVFAGRNRIFIFMNQAKDYRFKKYVLRLDDLNADVLQTALLDFNNDGCLDIYFSSLRGKHFIVMCEDFSSFGKPVILPAPSGIRLGFSLSAAFYDINRDKKADLLAGHWSRLGIPDMYASNLLYMSDANTYQPYRVYEAIGQTLSSIFSDINHDHHTDLMIGNDFSEPDMLYLWQPDQKKHQTYPAGAGQSAS